MRLARIISNDRPGHLLASLLLLALLACLALAPFLFPGTKSLDAAARICLFVVLAASFDIQLGYTGVVSFAHTMFYAFGAYGVAIALSASPTWPMVVLGTICGAALAALVATGVALLSLRVRKIFFAMITLAVASLAQLVATQWRDVTGGEDGITFAVPDLLSTAYRLFPEPVFGLRITGRVLTYYLIFVVSLALFLLMLRIVNAPFGRVLQAIRENEFRAEALGYRTIVYRTVAAAISAAIAACAGALLSLLLRYTGPAASLSFDIMVDILLMVVIGGMGTLYGPALGAAVIVLANTYLQPLLAAGHDALGTVPILPALIQPDRWLLWLGVFFVLIVYFLPGGIVGTLRGRRR